MSLVSCGRTILEHKATDPLEILRTIWWAYQNSRASYRILRWANKWLGNLVYGLLFILIIISWLGQYGGRATEYQIKEGIRFALADTTRSYPLSVVGSFRNQLVFSMGVALMIIDWSGSFVQLFVSLIILKMSRPGVISAKHSIIIPA